MTGDSPLGKRSGYPETYSPNLLFPIARAESREALGIVHGSGDSLPFQGVDIWNAWELTWLASSGQPRVAAAEIRVPADSLNIIESKSLKLYLDSFSMSRCGSADAARRVIVDDLTRCTGSDTEVSFLDPGTSNGLIVTTLPGVCIDDQNVDCAIWDVDADLLKADSSDRLSESLHSHILRSLCPVTSQPDSGSVLISYEGPKIDRPSLLRYIASFRQHSDFHEACVERMFLDIKSRCGPTKLSVYARYQRRGGIDINPFRSDYESTVANTRLWRQ